MESMLSLLITVIVLGVVFYLLYWLVGQIPLPAPFKVVATVLLGLFAVLILLGLLFGWTPIPRFR
jgi:heme A synthase